MKKKLLVKIILVPILLVLFLVIANKGAEAAGYGWVVPSVSGPDPGCGANRTYVTVRLKAYPGGGAVWGFMQWDIVGGGSGSSIGTSADIGCVGVSSGYYLNVNAGGYHQAWWGGGAGYDPPGVHDSGHTYDNIWLLPDSFGPSIRIMSPNDTGSWINYDPDWSVYMVPSPGHSSVGLLGFFVQNRNTGATPCNLCIKTGTWSAGTYNVGKLNLPNGEMKFGVWGKDNFLGGTTGVTAWSQGRANFGTWEYGYIGIDKSLPSISVSPSPSNPTPSQSVTVTANAAEQGGSNPLSGIDWVKVYVDNMATPKKTCGVSGTSTYSKSCSYTGGPYAAGSTHACRAVVRDNAGNQRTANCSFTVQNASPNTLNVNSTPPTGIYMDDQGGGVYDGTTNYTKNSSSNILTYINAPGIDPAGYTFDRWIGCDSIWPGSDKWCWVDVRSGASQTVTAVYTPVDNILNVRSTPPTGINMGSPDWFLRGTTNYTVNRSSDINGWVAAPGIDPAGYTFSNWTGCDSIWPADPKWCKVELSGGVTQTVTARYDAVDNILNVRSTPLPPPTGVVMGSPDWFLRGTTNYTVNRSSDINGWVAAPGIDPAGYTFSNWTGCDSIWPADPKWCKVELSGGVTQTVTARYDAVDNILNVRSTPPDDIDMTGLNDFFFDGTTNYTRTRSSDMLDYIVAPGVDPSGYTFVNWTNCDGIWFANDKYCWIDVRNGASQTVTANYIDALKPDLIVESISSTPIDFRIDDIEVGESVDFIGNIRNVGDANAGVSTARFCISSSANVVSVDQCYSNNLPAGSEWDSDAPTDPILSGDPFTVYSDISNPWIPATTGDHYIILCVDVFDDVAEPITGEGASNNCSREEIEVEEATPDPWLQTTGGDVGSFSNIDMAIVPPGAQVNADYLVISRSSVDEFFSDGWIIRGDGTLTVDPDPVPNIYQALWNKYRDRKEGADINSPDILNNGRINAGGIFLYVGDLTSINLNNYQGEPAVVFVTGSMTINSRMGMDDDTGIIFIVNGDITVDDGVEEIAGMFITNGVFNSNKDINCGDLNSDQDDEQLEINGAVHAFTQLCFTRDLGSDNDPDPAELINYEPKYLYLFGDIVGDPTVIYRETAP